MPQRELTVRLSAQAQQFTRAMASAERSFLSLRTAVAGGAAAIAAGLVKSTAEAVEFESAVTGVAKTVSGTETEIQQLAEQFQDLSEEIPVSANELAGLGQVAGQLGVQTSNIRDFVEVTAALSVAVDDLSGEEAATQLARFANVAGTSASEFENLASGLVDLGNTTAAMEGQILDFAQNIVSAGKQIGLTEGDIFGMSAAMVGLGANAEAAGTALQRVFLGIQDAVRRGTGELEIFAAIAGQTGEQFARTFEQAPDRAIQQFLAGLNRANEAGFSLEQVMETVDLQSQRTVRALLKAARASDQMAGKMAQGNRAIEENVALMEEAERRYGTSESNLDELGNAVTNVATNIGGLFKGALDESLGSMRPFIGSLSDATRAMFVASPMLAALRGELDELTESAEEFNRAELDRQILKLSSELNNLSETNVGRVRDLLMFVNEFSPAGAGEAFGLPLIERMLGSDLEGRAQALQDALDQLTAIRREMGEFSGEVQTTRESVLGLVSPIGDVDEGVRGASQSTSEWEQRMRELLDELDQGSSAVDELGESVRRLPFAVGVMGTNAPFIPGLALSHDQLQDVERGLEDVEDAARDLPFAVGTMGTNAPFIPGLALTADQLDDMADAMEDGNEELDKMAGHVERGLRGAVDLMGAFGGVDSSIQAATGSVINLAVNVKSIVDELGKANVNFAAVAGGIGAALGAVGSILSNILTSGGPNVSERAAQDLEVSVTLLGQNTEKLAKVVDNLGAELTANFASLAERFRGLDFSPDAIIDALAEQEAIEEFGAALDDLGLTFLDVKQLAGQMGINVDELIKILVTGEGNFNKAAQQLEFFIKALQQLPEAEEEAATEAERLAQQMDAVSQAFRDARDASALMIEVFEIEDLGKQLDVLVGDLVSSIQGQFLPTSEGGGQQIPEPLAQFLEMVRNLTDVNLGSASGLAQFQALLEDLFEAGAPEGLPEDVFESFLESLIRIRERAQREFEDQRGGGTGGGFTPSEPEEPSFIQRAAVTETQAQEMVVLERSQLLRLEQLVGLASQRNMVLADLPSNIADGVDINLAETAAMKGG